MTFPEENIFIEHSDPAVARIVNAFLQASNLLTGAHLKNISISPLKGGLTLTFQTSCSQMEKFYLLIG